MCLWVWVWKGMRPERTMCPCSEVVGGSTGCNSFVFINDFDIVTLMELLDTAPLRPPPSLLSSFEFYLSRAFALLARIISQTQPCEITRATRKRYFNERGARAPRDNTRCERHTSHRDSTASAHINYNITIRGTNKRTSNNDIK